MTDEDSSSYDNSHAEFFGDVVTGKFEGDTESEYSFLPLSATGSTHSILSLDGSVRKPCEGCKKFIPVDLEFCSEACKRTVRESRFQRRKESIIGTKTLPADLELRNIKSVSSFDKRQTRFVTRLLNRMKRSESGTNSISTQSSTSTQAKDLPEHVSRSLALNTKPTQKKNSFRIKKINSKVSPSPPTELNLAYSLRPRASPLEALLQEEHR